MNEDSKRASVGPAYIFERYIRHPLTKRNQEELDIEALIPHVLGLDQLRGTNRDGQYVSPIGFCLNDVTYGEYEGKAARKLGWRAYMNMGVPLVEEETDIEQPPPDMISKRTYINRTDPVEINWTDTVDFTVSNQISWSLTGQIQLTFGARASAQLQTQLQKSLAKTEGGRKSVKASYDRVGVDLETSWSATGTGTATVSATGTGEVSAQLMLGITTSVSGSVTTSWRSQSSMGGKISSRVDVVATQRRQVRRFEYEIPIAFGGYAAVYYPEPVKVVEDSLKHEPPEYSQVIARKIGDIDLTRGKPFSVTGEAETVSTLIGEHHAYDAEKLQDAVQPLYKP